MIVLILILSFSHQSITQPAEPANILEQFNTRTCGLTELPQGFDTGEQLQSARIHRGELAERNELPWLVYLEAENEAGDELVESCTGVIIDNYWVITAAHCLLSDTDINVRLGMYVFAGEKGRSSNVTGRVVGRTGNLFPFQPLVAGDRKKTFFPSQYILGTASYDIGLILLAEPLTFLFDVDSRQFFVNSICLPTLEPDMTRRYTIAGYGDLDREDQNEEQDVYKYESNILNNSVCSVAVTYGMLFDFARSRTQNDSFRMPDNYRQPTDNPLLVCVAAFDRKSTCHGDSGGPLQVPRHDLPDRWELAGVLHGGEEIHPRTFNIMIRTLFHQDNDTLAEWLVEHYKTYWPCDHMSYFNVIYQHRAWIRDTILANRPQTHWTAPFALGGVVSGSLISLYVRKRKFQLAELNVEIGPEEESDEPSKKRQR